MTKIFHNKGHSERSSERLRFDELSGRKAGFYPAKFAVFLLLAFFSFSAVCKAQDNPVLKIDDEITRFAYSASGRIAYATRHVFSVKRIQLQRDDIWICESDGKKRRILVGEKFVRGSGPFSYTVRALRWSPDSSKLTVELATSEMINDDGDTREGVSTLLLDDTGREITIAGGDSVIPGASNAAWMANGEAVVYFTAILKPKPQQRPSSSEPPPNTDKDVTYLMNRVRPATGTTAPTFLEHKFAAATWDTNKNTAVAVETDQGTITLAPAGPPRLVALDLARETLRPLGILEGYAGGLTLSPSGKKVAYWIDSGQLEVRDVDTPNRMARVRVPLGTLAWSADETRVMVKRGPVARSGGLVWLTLPPLATVAAGAVPVTVEVAPQSVLHDLEFRLFDISPDGRLLAVVEPGKRNLLVYPLS
jgi:hypothetical protein